MSLKRMSKRPGTATPGERLARAERERLMLRAAGEAFATQGFHGSSMDDIARAAGITKPMLYRYFGSKEGLYAAYLQTTGHELVDKMRAPETRGEPPEVRLRAGVRAFLNYVKEHRAGWTVLHVETTVSGRRRGRPRSSRAPRTHHPPAYHPVRRRSICPCLYRRRRVPRDVVGEPAQSVHRRSQRYS